jgi:uncharacterized protein
MNVDDLIRCIDHKAGKDRQVVVALSGGVDSGLTAWAAHAALADRVLAATLVSELTPARETSRAEGVASHIGIAFQPISISVLQDPRVRANGPDRCYHCKHLIFMTLSEAFEPDTLFLDGTNADDDPDRPGLKALKEYGVWSPLRETGLGKAAVRDMARAVGLPNWDAPSESCLAVRIPWGTPLDAEALCVVETLEAHCHGLGVETLRVHYDDMVAIVEYMPQYAGIMNKYRDSVVALAQRIGVRSCQFKEWNG